jgi:hypothetical protein
MALSTARGLTYPESTDPFLIADSYQTLANTAETAVAAVDANLAALSARVAFAVGSASLTLSGSGATTYSGAFTWPASRFTQPPAVIVTNLGGVGSSNFYLMTSGPPDAAGGVVLAINRDGAVVTLTAALVHVQGVQMTSGSGFG